MPRSEYREPKKFEIKDNYLYIDGEKVCKVDHYKVNGGSEPELILGLKLNNHDLKVDGVLPWR